MSSNAAPAALSRVTLTPAAGRPCVVSRMCVLIPIAITSLREEPFADAEPRDLRLLGGRVVDLGGAVVVDPLLEAREDLGRGAARREQDEDEAVLFEVLFIEVGEAPLDLRGRRGDLGLLARRPR